MPLQRDPKPWELAIVADAAPGAVASWVDSQSLGWRLSSEDRHDLAEHVVEAFVRFWRTDFEYGFHRDVSEALKKGVRAIAWRVLPDVVGDYGGPVSVSRDCAEAGRACSLVQYDGDRDHRRASDDIERGLRGTGLRRRIAGRLLALLPTGGERPAWFRGLELAAGMTAEELMDRYGLDRRQVHYGRDALLRLFARDPELQAAVEDAEDLGDSLTGLCAEVLAADAARALAGWVIAVSSVEVPPRARTGARVYVVTAPPGHQVWDWPTILADAPGPVAQTGERPPCTRLVGGSIPPWSTFTASPHRGNGPCSGGRWGFDSPARRSRAPARAAPG